MNSKIKGNIGEAIILSEFAKREIQVSIPFGDTARYDLIAEFNGKLNKIQIKYCNQQVINGSVMCPCASSTNHTTNKNLTNYKEDVDYIAFYLAEWEVSIIIPIEIIGNRKSIAIRKDKPLNNQSNFTSYSDYSFDRIILRV